jgi:hypothetical protein
MDAIATSTKPKPVEPAPARDTVTVSRALFENLLSVLVYRIGGNKYDEDDERGIALALVRELRTNLKETKP